MKTSKAMTEALLTSGQLGPVLEPTAVKLNGGFENERSVH